MGEVVTYAADRIQGSDLVQFWPRIEEELRKIPHTWDKWWTLDELYHLVVMGNVQLWGFGKDTAITLVVFTQVVIYPTGKVLQIFLSYGQGIEEAMGTIEALMEHFADYHGCVRVEIVGRPAWTKVLKGLGFRLDNVVLSRPVAKLRKH